MAKKFGYGERIEKNIYYNKDTDTYLVFFNFNDFSALNSFSTLEAAKKYKEDILNEKQRLKTERTIKKLRERENKYICEEEPFPFNVFAAARLELKDLDKDIVDNFEKHLTSCCSTRESDFIFAYYEDKLTLQEIGKFLNITRERTRQIIAKGLAKFRHYCYRYETEKKEKERDKYRQELLKEFNDTNELSSEMLKEFNISNLTIDDLDLSVRTYNCLRKAGIYKVNTLLEMSNEDIMQIKNLGKKSYLEILKVLDNIKE